MHRHSHNVIDGHLNPLRAAAQERAETLVDGAMANRRVVDRDEFERTVFDTEVVDAATAQAVARLTHYLERRVGVAAADVAADLEAVTPQTATVAGTAGRGYRRSVIGVAVLAAAVLFAWNVGPLVLAAGAVAGFAVPRLRNWLGKRAATKYEEELSRARGAARQAVTDTFDAIRDGIADWFLGAARTAMVQVLGDLTAQALTMREVVTTAKANRKRVEESAGRVDGWTDGVRDPATVLREAMRRCEEDAQSRGSALWLGEAWCDDPTNLRDPSAVPAAHVRAPGPDVLPALVRGRLPAVLAEAARTPRLGSGTFWLVRLGELLADDPAAGPVLAELERLRADHRPRVLVYGDYDSGKSSFIRRLLVDDREPVPPTLTVSARPETQDVHEYRWGEFRLIDTPGLQSGTARHDDEAQRSLPDAALIVYMLGANPVTSDRTGLDLVLRGDPDRGVLPKLDRTVFVVNRADELSVNPLDDPDGFAQVIARRERELRDALVGTPELRRLGVTVAPERIVFVASDPFGQVGDADEVTSADFDECRDWDGMDEVRAAFDELALRLQANSVDVGILHAGVAALGELMAANAAVIARDGAAIEQLGGLAGDVHDRMELGRLLADDQHAALTRTGLGFIDEAVTEALQLDDDKRREARLNRAVQFRDDRELGQRVEEWAEETNRRVADWVRETAVVLQRRIDSQAFRRALWCAADPAQTPAGTPPVPDAAGRHPAVAGAGPVGRAGRPGGRTAARPAGGEGRDRAGGRHPAGRRRRHRATGAAGAGLLAPGHGRAGGRGPGRGARPRHPHRKQGREGGQGGARRRRRGRDPDHDRRPARGPEPAAPVPRREAGVAGPGRRVGPRRSAAPTRHSPPWTPSGPRWPRWPRR